MGGKGSGGRRRGAGRKPKTAAERFIDGNAGHRGRILSHPSAPAAPDPVVVDEFDAPNDLTVDERNVWVKLAPFAFKNGTLTKASSLAFCRLCAHIVLEKRYAGSVQEAGGANHRGLIQKVDAAMDAFGLRPLAGKRMPDAEAAKPVEPVQKRAYW
jgi:hypothetical protein